MRAAVFDLMVITLSVISGLAAAFVHNINNSNTNDRNNYSYHCLTSPRRHSAIQRSLISLTSLSEDLGFIADRSNPRYNIAQEPNEEGPITFYIPEAEDLPELSQFIVRAFGADMINLSQDFSAAEQFLLQPISGFLNGYSEITAYTEVLNGLRQRLRARLEHPNVDAPDLGEENVMGRPNPQRRQQGQQQEQEQLARAAEQTSLVFVFAKQKKKSGGEGGGGDNNRKEDEDQQQQPHEILASVELRLVLTDGKIPFTLPWLDRLERRLASLVGFSSTNPAADLQPYLSSLCVDETYRKRGLGRALVHCCEDVARICWGCNRLYLHVDPDNIAAVQLYVSEGYKNVEGIRWNPFWAGSASQIGYYVKELEA